LSVTRVESLYQIAALSDVFLTLIHGKEINPGVAIFPWYSKFAKRSTTIIMKSQFTLVCVPVLRLEDSDFTSIHLRLNSANISKLVSTNF
jgi:hypothetical protein